MHPFVPCDRAVAFGLEAVDLLVEFRQEARDLLLDFGIADVLELVEDDGPRLLEVLAHSDGLFEALLGLRARLDVAQAAFPERSGVGADHLAVDLVRLLEKTLRLGVLPRAPGVEAHGLHALREALLGEQLLIGIGRLETNDGAELHGPLDQFRSAGLDVPDVFLLSIRVADVEPILADVDPDVRPGRIHGILSLSSDCAGTRSAFRCPFNHTVYDHKTSGGAPTTNRSTSFLGRTS